MTESTVTRPYNVLRPTYEDADILQVNTKNIFLLLTLHKGNNHYNHSLVEMKSFIAMLKKEEEEINR